ncbi:hypothetical protein GCM10009798_24520 [Nocardioides panacihumi]|uniref:Inosine/uridine-preferring nucleoside hydrolase domain-containing protein n=1 Tax=Nocardioides panacihumi TaxID=400774 RepID=A0ABN2R4K5_9ACTN
MRALAAFATAVALLACGCASACTAAYDDDGEVMPPGQLSVPAAKHHDAVDVVVDTDLAPDDLVALAYLLRHPGVRVLAVTVPATGMVWCPAGVDIAHDLMVAVRADPVPISCGTTARGPHGVPFPADWSVTAASDSGLQRDDEIWTKTDPTPPAALIGRLAKTHPGLQVVELAPATELAALLRSDPTAYSRIDRIVAMTGVAAGPPQDATAGEWNAAADPDALAAVLAGPVPMTIVPNEVVPDGSPAGMRQPVVGGIGVLTAAPPPRFWDLATAAYFTHPDAGGTRTGRWSVALTGEPGRLTREGDGDDAVVTSLDTATLDAAYREVFAPER